MYRKVSFEVYGRVQGVYFRACTQEKAKNLGINGWVRNTSAGTVEGEIEGQSEAIEKMKEWLSKEGSPQSQITSCEFERDSQTESPSFDGFEILKKRK